MVTHRRSCDGSEGWVLLVRVSVCGLWLVLATSNLLSEQETTPDGLLEQGSFAAGAQTTSQTFKIATYNLHGPLTEDSEAVFAVLEKDPVMSDTQVWALQEVRTDEKRNFARETAQRLHMNYAHAVARPRGGGWEGISFLSRLPLSDVVRLELPHLDTGARLRIALFATVSVDGRPIRLCNAHLPIRMDHDYRTEQLQKILEQFEKDKVAARILLGDFNTITGGLRNLYHRVLEKHGFQTPFEGNDKTYQKYFFVRLKVDWIYLTGLKVLEKGIEQAVKASDHRPVWIKVRPPT